MRNPFRLGRQRVLLLVVSLAFLLGSSPLVALQNPQSLQDPLLSTQDLRLIVKLAPSVASQAEASLSASDLEIRDNSPQKMTSLFSQYKIKRMSPLDKKIARWKRSTGKSEQDFVNQLKTKYLRRTGRAAKNMKAPEISRTYLLEPRVANNEELYALLARLKKDARFESVELDRLVNIQSVPNDPYFSSHGSWGEPYDDLYGIKGIFAPTAWDSSTGSGITVAVVDTGIDRTHPDIAANIWNNPNELGENSVDDDQNGFVDDTWGWDFVHGTNDPIDDFGHGTHVAGTIAAVGNNGIGIIGVAPQAKVMAVKAFNSSGAGYESWIYSAIVYAANSGADVINASWGGEGFSQTEADAIDYAYALGVTIVAAAGNANKDISQFFPASDNNVICVAASTPTDGRANFSNWGNVDVIAPGVDILSLRATGTSMGYPVDNLYTRADGTSMATPHVSGLVALLLSAHPQWTSEQVRQVIRKSAVDLPYTHPGFDFGSGYGKIDAAAALAIANPPEAHIESPESGNPQTGNVTIRGSANGPTFSGYLLEYGVGNDPQVWFPLFQGTMPVVRGILGNFDSRLFPDGTYTIRLTVTDTTQTTWVDRKIVQVQYLTITDPQLPAVPAVAREFKAGVGIGISGTAAGPSFQRFHIEWSQGLSTPSDWSSSGITLTGGGASPISDAPLAIWDSSTFGGKAGYYQIRLSVENAGFTSTAKTYVYIDPDLASSAWPKKLSTSPWWNEGPSIARDDQGQPSLVLALPNILGGGDASFHRFSKNGDELYSLTYPDGFYNQAAVGDLGGTPGDEAVVWKDGHIRMVKPDNTFVEFSPNSPYNFKAAPLLVQDLNHDGKQEIVTLGSDLQNGNHYLYVFDNSGILVSNNFPVLVPNKGNVTPNTYLLAADLDGDGKKEILVISEDDAASSSLKVFDSAGVARNWNIHPVMPTSHFTNFAAADLYHDGRFEILLAVTETTPTSGGGYVNGDSKLYLLDSGGNIKPGWPVKLPAGCTEVASADLDRDGTDEVVVSGLSYIEVLKPDGSPLSTSWPYVNSQARFSQFSIGDVDSDGFPDIVIVQNDVDYYDPLTFQSISATTGRIVNEVRNGISSTTVQMDGRATPSEFTNLVVYRDNSLQVIDRNGQFLNSWKILGIEGDQSAPTVCPLLGDFDSDGKVDIALSYPLIQGGGTGGYNLNGGMIVFSLSSDVRADALDWPMNLHDPQNSSVRTPYHAMSRLNSIALDAANYTLITGGTKSVSVTAKYSDNSTHDATGFASYQVADPSVATVDGTGHLSGAGAGITTLTVSYQGLTTTAQVVVQRAMTALSADAVSYSLMPNVARNAIVTAYYSDGSSGDVSASAVYSITDPTVATVDASGLVRAVKVGSTVLTVRYQYLTVTVQINVVSQILTMISLDSTSYTVLTGGLKTVVITATYQDNTTQNISNLATYIMIDTSIAMIDTSGNIRGLAQGTTTLVVVYQNKTLVVPVIVQRAISALAADSATYTLMPTVARHAIVTAYYPDGSSADVTVNATYSMADPTVASVDPSGSVQALKVGTTTLSIAYQYLTVHVQINVVAQVLVSISLDSSSYTVSKGKTKNVIVTATYQDHTMQDISNVVTYIMVDPSIATVNSSGTLTGIAQGSTTLIVVYQNKTLIASVSVQP